jgi:hypothetical protein
MEGHGGQCEAYARGVPKPLDRRDDEGSLCTGLRKTAR